jgi:hypothetical protein
MMTPEAFKADWETTHDGAPTTLQEPTNHQLSQQVDR